MFSLKISPFYAFSRIFLLFIIGSFCLQSCKKTIEIPNLRQGNGGIFYGGVFRVNESAELRSLDPVRIQDVTSSHIAEQIFDNLLTLDENLSLEHGLAYRWSVSEDGKTYTYHLRSGVYFHDNKCFPNGKGRLMTAQDFKYSLTRVCDPRTGSLNYEYFKGKIVGAEQYYESIEKATASSSEPTVKEVSGLIAKDDSTFQIQLEKPFAPFEFMVTLSSCAVIPKEAVELYGKDFFQNPVGTGPFLFQYWRPDRDLLATRNNRYWKKDSFGNQLPYLDAVRFSFLKDEKTQLLEFKEGNLEESYRIPSEFFLGMVDVEKQKLKGSYERFTLYSVSSLATQYYGMMVNSNELQDKRVRQAISYAVDRDRIIRYVLQGQAAGPGSHGLIPPSMPEYQADSIKGFTFNLDKARALMAEAGYPYGKGFPVLTLQVNAGGGRNLLVAEAIQGMLQENLGITVELKQVEFAKHLEEIDNGRAAFYRLGWVADYPDPETFLNLLYGKLVPPKGISPVNSVRYQNPEFDKLFELALSTTNTKERMAIYRQAEQIAINDAPMLIIFYDQDYRLVQPYVENYKNNSMDKRRYKYVWFNKDKY
jgi:oligopeptide transport system substrate-binding protein